MGDSRGMSHITHLVMRCLYDSYTGGESAADR